MKELNRRSFIKGLGAAGAAGFMTLSLSKLGAAKALATKPNFVFILIDDMGRNDIGCYGSRFCLTPNVDRLATQGMKFTDAYAACPVCSPTRASIMTGRYPARLHLANYLTGWRWPDNSPLTPMRNWTTELRPEEVTIAEQLRSAGYYTGLIGRWHLNNESAERSPLTQPEDQGFDHVVTSLTNHTDKRASSITDAAISFLTANKDRPFFLYIGHFSVHIPLEATPELIAKYRARVESGDPQNNPTYGGMVECVDTSVGRIMDKLTELGIADNTVLVFFADNGGLSVKEGANTPATSNLPFKGGKGYTYEGGIREPFIVRWPGTIAAGSTCSTPVCSIDFFPTFLELAGATKPSDLTIDGKSIVPLLKQTGTIDRDALFWHYPHYSNQGGLPSGAVRMGDYKLIRFYGEDKVELYNLKDDIGEKNDLSASMPAKVTELRTRLDNWLASVDAQVPVKNPDYDPTKPYYSDPTKEPEAWKDNPVSVAEVEPEELRDPRLAVARCVPHTPVTFYSLDGRVIATSLSDNLGMIHIPVSISSQVGVVQFRTRDGRINKKTLVPMK